MRGGERRGRGVKSEEEGGRGRAVRNEEEGRGEEEE